VVDVPVEVGFPNKDKIIVKEHGNEHPDARAGDLVVIVTVKPTKAFVRKGDDLFITKKISLIEALSGV
jgi:DnaJ-class molecular chaperone